MGNQDNAVISHRHSNPNFDANSTTSSADLDLIGQGGLGAQRAELIAKQITPGEKWAILTSLLLLGFTYGLESMLRVVYQPLATSAFANHSTLATVNVLRSVVAAAAYPAAARLSDVFGRLEMTCTSIALYVLGIVIDANCKNVKSFAAGAVIYQLGFTMLILLVEVIIADITPLKWRLSASYIPTIPLIWNTWISGTVSESVLKRTSWRWAMGMWGFILAGTSIPLIISLLRPYRRIRNSPSYVAHESPWRALGPRRFFQALFWQLDVIGIILLIIIFSGILAPFTIAGGKHEQWKQAKILAPLIIGIFCIPVWLFWEKYSAKSTLIPFKLLADRAVWGALGIAWLLYFCWTLQANFLYTVLIVAFDESVTSATRIVSLYSFVSVLTGLILGFIVRWVRHVKLFIIAGALLFLPAFGLLIRFRGGSDSTNHNGIIGSQILLGFAAGFVPYPTQTTIQAATRHEHVAIITGLFLATFNIGSAFGSAVSGAIWTQTLIPSLRVHLPEPYDTEAMAKSIFANPFDYASRYPIGDPLRDAIVLSYMHTQKMLTVTGICLCAPLIIFSLVLRNVRLGDEQSLPNAEAYDGNTQAEKDGEWNPFKLWK